MGDDGPWRSAETAPPGVCHRGKNIHIRSAKSLPGSQQQRSSALVRRGGESASGHHRRGQNTDPSVAKALHRAVARRGRPHGVGSRRNRRGNPCALRSSDRIRRAVRPMSTEPQRTCSSCGNEFSGAMEFCPVCMLRKALAGDVESGESSASEDTVRPTPEQAAQRFEHYELVSGEDGKPVELGRGAMGVTYKAFDVDLRCPVTLKVINEKYLGDESARLRFLREARAAAKVRHSNVASVLHLGRTRTGYFYAMEFVEGETVEHLIKRSGGLEVNLALEIVMQVAAGLVAIHKQKLVHRDIKPSNIMVNLEEGGAATAKIIDLGLAKAVNEAGFQTAISTPGGFAGTPEFASPEQFAGVQVDIRSDLYSLGVTLWAMVTGQIPFRGPSAEVMYQHQHAPLPLERLKDVAQPVVVLLEKLLKKDPAQRFQTPDELLKAMPTITGAIEARPGTTRRNLQQITPPASRVGTRKQQARLGPKKMSVARLPIA